MDDSLLNAVDFPVARFFNQWVRSVWWWDQSLAFLSESHLLKGGVLMALLWWAWFRRGRFEVARAHIVVTLASCALALAVGRAMVHLFVHRPRPLHEPALRLAMPYGVAEQALNDLSSFPSDHAVLFFALAAGFFFVDRWLGWLALAYVSVCIALPRLYLGLHYLSDIAVGAAVGVALSVAGNLWLGRGRAAAWTVGWAERAPWLFYPAMFLVTHQIADLFEDSRLLVKGIHALATHMAG
jgi:undecaprenyl-diphosphatase